MKWRVEVLNESVQKELDALPPDVRARLTRIVELIEEFGLLSLGAPYVRHLEDKLWEIRIKGQDGIARVIYITANPRRVVLLHAFRKKTQKTPRKALNIARNRAKELKP